MQLVCSSDTKPAVWQVLSMLYLCSGCLATAAGSAQAEESKISEQDAGRPGRARRQAAAATPLRVTFHHLASANGSALGEAKRTRLDAVLNATRDWAAAALTVAQPSPQPLRLNRDCVDADEVFFRRQAPTALNQYFCRPPKRCRNATRCGLAVASVPAEHLEKCQICFTRGSFLRCDSDPADTAPEQPGLANTDVVVYVVSDCALVREGRLAAGDSCLRFAETDRPNAGWLAVCPSRFGDQTNSLPYEVAEVQRELVRILGVSKREFPYWHDSADAPRTRRDLTSHLPIGSGPGRVDSTTLSSTLETQADGSMLQRYSLITPGVMSEGRRRFGCSTLAGVPMEDYDDQFDSFEMRVVGQSELLTVRSFLASYKLVAVVSRLTLAALEDTGWYVVNRQLAFASPYGAGRGCSFVLDNCLEYVNASAAPSPALLPYTLYTANVTEAFAVPLASWAAAEGAASALDPNAALPYCNAVRTATALFARCSGERQTVAACSLANTSVDFNASAAAAAQTPFQAYFQTSSVQGLDPVSNYCPTFSSLLPPPPSSIRSPPTSGVLTGSVARCDDLASAPAVNWALEQYSARSLCVEHARVWERLPKGASAYQRHNRDANAPYYGAGCYRRDCLSDGSLRIWIAGVPMVCQTRDQVLEFSLTANTIPYRGSIVCPSPADFCAVRRCPDNCSWHGDCIDVAGTLTCHCYPGYKSSTCGTLVDGSPVDLLSASSSNPDIGPPETTYFTPTVLVNIAVATLIVVVGSALLFWSQCVVPSLKMRRKAAEARKLRTQQATQAQSADRLEMERINDMSQRARDSVEVVDHFHGAIYPRQPGWSTTGVYTRPEENQRSQEPLSQKTSSDTEVSQLEEGGEVLVEVSEDGIADMAVRGRQGTSNQRMEVGVIQHVVSDLNQQPGSMV